MRNAFTHHPLLITHYVPNPLPIWHVLCSWDGSTLLIEEKNVLFDRTSEGLTAVVHYAGLRHKIIANNLANIDTPGYRALDISFREQLERFMKMVEGNSRKARKRGSRGAGCPALPPPALTFAPDINGLRPGVDRNTVDMDQELSKLSQNTILHNACLQLLNSKFRILKSAISGNA